MKKTLLSFLMAIVAVSVFAQLNMQLLDQRDYNVGVNDVWGWADTTKNLEYAIVGLVTGVSIVDVTDPTDIQEVQFIPGPDSPWRDIKTWGNHAYVTNETSNGVLVIDLTEAPTNITWFEWTPSLAGLGQLRRCHNLYIDEFGYCYLAGCNLNSGGMLLVDVFSDPGNPQFVSAAPAVYSHDVYARDNRMYSSQINAGNLGIYDVSDKQNITLLATQPTPRNFTHNAWLNDAGDVVFTTDEKANSPVAAYDISDLNDIVELDQFRPVETLGEGVIPHNVHVWEDWLIISYYTDGGIIADASRPENIIEVGNWDTFLGGNGGFSGAWGAYPFLPSGVVLLSDRSDGLIVCGADYVRACWLEGKVTNAVTGASVFGAEVSIDSPQPNYATSDLIGKYETGQAIPGTFDVTFTHPAYHPKTVSATLENGILTILDVELEPKTNFDIGGQTIKKVDGTAAPNALIILDGEDLDFTIYSDADGNFVLDDVVIGDYTVYAGGWGYFLEIIDNFTVDAFSPTLTIELTEGYQDDFFLDLGWTATGDAETGLWERGEPNGTFAGNGFVNPGFDIQTDFGDQCYVTGNGGGSAGDDDVDNGTVTLTSPSMDLSNYGDPVLSYYSWFVNRGNFGGIPNDELVVKVSNGIEEVTLESITESEPFWKPLSRFHLADYIILTDNMQIIFETSDFDDTPHQVEAAVDVFKVVDEVPYPPFSSSQTQGCTPYIVDFSDKSDTTATYLWTFEGGNPATSNEPNPTVEYTVPGVYDVSLEVVTDSGNVYTISRKNLVNIGIAPTADFTTVVIGADVVLVNISTGGGIYNWDFGNGQSSTEENPSDHSYDAVGVYNVVLTMANECGFDTFMQEVEILAIPPTANFTVSEIAGCTPFEVQFTDESEGVPVDWAWTFLGGDPATSTEQHPLVTYNTPGTWSVELIVTNAAGISTEQKSQLITVGLNPTVDFDFSVNGPDVSFTNASSNANSYTWTFGDGEMSNEANPVHTFPGIGEYDVTLTVENECGIVVLSQVVVVNSATGVEFLDETDYQTHLSPNPFADHFMLSYDLKKPFDNARVAVYNVLGQQVSSLELTTASGSVQMGQELSQSGVYLVHLMLDGKVGKTLRAVKL